VLIIALALVACSDGNDGAMPDSLLAITVPTISDPPAEGEPSLLSTTFPLADVGYKQQEFFLTGVAQCVYQFN